MEIGGDEKKIAETNKLFGGKHVYCENRSGNIIDNWSNHLQNEGGGNNWSLVILYWGGLMQHIFYHCNGPSLM